MGEQPDLGDATLYAQSLLCILAPCILMSCTVLLLGAFPGSGRLSLCGGLCCLVLCVRPVTGESITHHCVLRVGRVAPVVQLLVVVCEHLGPFGDDTFSFVVSWTLFGAAASVATFVAFRPTEVGNRVTGAILVSTGILFSISRTTTPDLHEPLTVGSTPVGVLVWLGRSFCHSLLYTVALFCALDRASVHDTWGLTVKCVAASSFALLGPAWASLSLAPLLVAVTLRIRLSGLAVSDDSGGRASPMPVSATALLIRKGARVELESA